MNSEELIDILCEKIDRGFTFPLNPKWLLCDPGWKQVYDKLLASSKANVQASMNIWYPEDIRRRIHEISRQFPHGFVHYGDKTRRTSSVSVDLAEMELKRYQVLRQGRKKMRKAMLKRGGNLQGDKPTLFSTALAMLRLGKEVDDFKQKHPILEVIPDHTSHSNDDSDGSIVSGDEREHCKNGNEPSTLGGNSQLGTPKRGSKKKKSKNRRASLSKLFKPILGKEGDTSKQNDPILEVIPDHTKHINDYGDGSVVLGDEREHCKEGNEPSTPGGNSQLGILERSSRNKSNRRVSLSKIFKPIQRKMSRKFHSFGDSG